VADRGVAAGALGGGATGVEGTDETAGNVGTSTQVTARSGGRLKRVIIRDTRDGTSEISTAINTATRTAPIHPSRYRFVALGLVVIALMADRR
jgi:hypothetical protein